MSTFKIIQQKLETFITKYYTNELIRGALLFLAIGLLYFLITLLVEYYFWLSSTWRAILFWSFVVIELSLFARFIIFPLAKLFKLRKGINYEEASRIIGNHFPEVNDKLLNVIQLNRNKHESELLAASIDQKAQELQPIQFQGAINFKKNFKYLKYVAIPVFIFVLFGSLGGLEMFSSSYTRVVNYDVAYEPPAPFTFVILNEQLNAIENKPFTLKVSTDGTAIPENASVLYNGEAYYMQRISPGLFEYTFQQPTEKIGFNLRGNKVTSRQYSLDVIQTPSLLNFELELDYPAHTGKSDETLKGTGNATIPEGTKVKWNVSAKNTSGILLKTQDSIYSFKSKDDHFNFENRIFSKLDYTITTSNEALKDYENLSYTLNVIKDQYPEIDVQSTQDSIDSQRILFLGRASDDYGITKLQMVYYPENNVENAKVEKLPLGSTNFEQFTFEFPGALELQDGVSYEYYFEVFDNDALHNYKSSKSGVYSYRKLTKEEVEDQQLENQQKAIRGLDNSLDEMRDRKEILDELSRTQKEKSELNYNDRKKLEEFLNRQKQQEEMMKNFSEQLKEDLENFQPENKQNDPFKEQLQERLKENEERLKENEKLLEELQKLQEKIQKEDLTEKLEKLSKQNKNQEKNLEQLLELTKRYYVEKKAEKIAEDLTKLGEKQEKLADKSEKENTKEAQEELNKAFEDLKEQMEDLKKENDELKKPMDIPSDETMESEIDEEQQEATDKLEKQNPQDASKNQMNAGEKMKQMGKKMQQQMKSGQMDTIEEDVKMLRQILSNLVVFSFQQEDLMSDFKEIKYGNPVYGKKLNIQNELKLHFEHIDDSLFSLALRQPMIGDKINSTLTDIQYNIEKSLDRLAQNQLPQGVANQQYTMKGANDLAVLLEGLLNNMQMQMSMGSGSSSGEGMPSPGEGEGGKGFQLPDIIEKQKSLSDQMKDGIEKGESGDEGEQGEDGQEGQNGQEGQGEGQSEGEGQQGDSGNKSGNNQGDGQGNQQGYSENLSGELYEIFKQQQQLRQELENRLNQLGIKGSTHNILKQIENIEQELLEKGFNKSTLKKMENLQYELLKLDEAAHEQGKEEMREAETNTKDYKNQLRLTPEEIKKYFNTIEILNREALPLRNEYKLKVQDYFKN